jgi:hypothetical protein
MDQRSAVIEAEIARARREMLNHLSQRVIGVPSRRQIKRYMQQGSRSVWRNLLKFDAQPSRKLYMPGAR